PDRGARHRAHEPRVPARLHQPLGRVAQARPPGSRARVPAALAAHRLRPRARHAPGTGLPSERRRFADRVRAPDVQPLGAAGRPVQVSPLRNVMTTPRTMVARGARTDFALHAASLAGALLALLLVARLAHGAEHMSAKERAVSAERVHDALTRRPLRT